jgi:hypothetical protein
VGTADALDINGQAAGNTAGLSSRDRNGRVPQLSKTVDATGALDINSGVDSHASHVRPTWPLGHSTHYMPASGGDRYGHAPELSRKLDVAGALDINGRAAGNVVDLSSRNRNSGAPKLSRTVNTACALDINGGVEGHICHMRSSRRFGHSTHSTPAFDGDGEMGIVVYCSGENAYPTEPWHASDKGHSQRKACRAPSARPSIEAILSCRSRRISALPELYPAWMIKEQAPQEACNDCR